MKRGTALFGLLAIVLLASLTMAGQPLQKDYIGTVMMWGWQVRANNSNWTDANWLFPTQVLNFTESNGSIGYNEWAIGLSSNGGRTGTLIPGFGPTGWNGVWFARKSFDLPSWANYAVLLIQPIVRQRPNAAGHDLYATDDRVVLGLNDPLGLAPLSATVGWTLTQANNPLNVQGVQNSAEYGKNNIPYVFQNRSQMYVTDQTAFKFGQTNWIYLTINNTGSYDAKADSTAWTTATDNTFVGVDVWVIYGDKSQFPH